MKVVPKKGLRVSILLRYKLFFISSEIASQVFFFFKYISIYFPSKLAYFSTKDRKVWKDKRMLQCSITKCFQSVSVSTSISIRSFHEGDLEVSMVHANGVEGWGLIEYLKEEKKQDWKLFLRYWGVFFFSVKFILGLFCNAYNFIHVKNDYRPTAQNLLEK